MEVGSNGIQHQFTMGLGFWVKGFKDSNGQAYCLCIAGFGKFCHDRGGSPWFQDSKLARSLLAPRALGLPVT